MTDDKVKNTYFNKFYYDMGDGIYYIFPINTDGTQKDATQSSSRSSFLQDALLMPL
jgi:hypothetical protein